MDGDANVTSISNGPEKASDCQTAAEFIDDQLRLEADAREALPYAFDMCTRPLGSLRQALFSCLTCNPPPSSPTDTYTPAGICYSCSISCHGEHTLAELFPKRNFVCDCGTTRLPSTSPCTLRINPVTGMKGGSHSEPPVASNKYGHNFLNRFCSCDGDYDPTTEKGTMYQCLGLGTVEDGGCGEDWWHPSCLVGLPLDWHKKEGMSANGLSGGADDEEDGLPPPPGFPDEDSFTGFICWKCVKAHPWIKRYAGTRGFLEQVFRATPDDASDTMTNRSMDLAQDVELGNEEAAMSADSSKKRKADEEDLTSDGATAKKVKSNDAAPDQDLNGHKPSSPATASAGSKCRYKHLPPAPEGNFSLFFTEDFRSQFCRCAVCFPKLAAHPQLLEEEDTYEPPLSSESGNNADDNDAVAGRSSVGTNSLLDRGERALSNVDRVRAIEGVMVYNDLKEKVKAFLKPFAETGQPVGAEHIKEYFEKLRGDAEAVKAANAAAVAAAGGGGGSGSDHRKEQGGY